MVVDHDRLGHGGGTVALVEAQILFLGADLIAVQRVGPFDLAMELASIGIEQQLVRIETMPGLGLVAAMRAVAIKQARPDIRQIAMPYLVGAFGQGIAPQFPLSLGIKDTKLDPVRIG